VSSLSSLAVLVPTRLTPLLAHAEKSSSTAIPSVLHFSAQQEHTKYTIAQLFARLHSPPLELDDRLVRVSDGPKPGETVRPQDCHLSNVRPPLSLLFRSSLKACSRRATLTLSCSFSSCSQRAIEALGIDTSRCVDFETWWREYLKSE